jgi:hypothetical protein
MRTQELKSTARRGRLSLAVLCLVASGTAGAAVYDCEMNGEHVNPANGSTYARSEEEAHGGRRIVRVHFPDGALRMETVVVGKMRESERELAKKRTAGARDALERRLQIRGDAVVPERPAQEQNALGA